MRVVEQTQTHAFLCNTHVHMHINMPKEVSPHTDTYSMGLWDPM